MSDIKIVKKIWLTEKDTTNEACDVHLQMCLCAFSTTVTLNVVKSIRANHVSTSRNWNTLPNNR